MRILVLNQYFHPDVASTGQLLTELCEDLAGHHEVTVVVGRPSYDPTERDRARGLVHQETYGKVRVLRTWSTSFARRNLLGRLSNYATYLTSSMVGALQAPRPDVILTMTDPPIVAAVAMLAGRLRRVPYVYVCQDIFPEVGVVLGHLRNPGLVKGLGALNRALRRRAAAVVTIGRDMEDRLLALGAPPDRITVIPNWTDGSLIRPLEGPSPLREEQGWGDRFVVMHSGNVGLSQSLETLIDAATLLRDQEDISFAIIGDGAAKAGLQRRVEEKDLRNVVFLPYQEKASLSVSLGAADVHYVGLRRGLGGFIVPSKVYGILAAGKPFIAAVEAAAEPARIAREHECGLVVEPDNATALADTILQMRREPLQEMGRRARAAFEERFDRPVATDAYRRLLEQAAKS